jgi:hypothetical protein
MEAEDIMTTRIKLRRDTAANWISSNPILSSGEPGLETDTRKIKYGDGATAWRDLDYANSKIQGRTPIEVTTQDPSSWVNVIGRPRNDSSVTAVVYDTKGNVITLSYNSNGAPESENDAFTTITKFDDQGNILWQSDIGGYTPAGYGLDTDSNDNIYLSVTQRPNGGSDAYVVVIKLNSNGVRQWAEGFGHAYDCAAFLVVDNNGYPVVNGYSSDPGSDGGYLIRLDKTTGAVTTNVRFTDDENGQEITNQGLAIDAENNIVLTGSHYDGTNTTIIVQKLSGVDFSHIWSKQIDTVDQYDIDGGGVACDGANNIYLTGSFTGQESNVGIGNIYKTVVMKLNSDGVVQWSRDIKGECNQGGTAIVVGPNDNNLYLISTTYTPTYRDSLTYHEYQQAVALACYEAGTGKVLWQNYIVQNQLSETSPGRNINNDFNYNRGQVIDMQGDHIVVGGIFVPHARNGYGPGYDDWGMSTGWVMQFPSSGDNVDIGGWKLKTSRIPGRYQSFKTTPHSINYNTDVFEYGAEGSDIGVNGSSVINTVRITQDSNTWTFDLKGDLNLPADGDLALAKKNVGWVNLQGFKYNGSEDVEFQGVCVDPDENSYAFGYENNYGKPYIVKYSTTGEVLWEMRLDNTYNGALYGYIEAGAWDSVNNNLVIASTRDDTPNNQTLITRLDPLTGKVLSNITLDAGTKGMNVYDMQVNSYGDPVVAGQIYGGFKEHSVSVQTSTSGTNFLDVLASDFTDGVLPIYNDSNWLISGTGIDGLQYLYTTTNSYNNVDSTKQVGSGAQFDVTVVDSTYSVVVTAGQGGSGYKVNDQLLISAANIGGGDSSNDLVLNVDTVDGGVILTVSIVSGSSAGADAVYTAQGAAPILGAVATFYAERYLDTNNSNTPTYYISTVYGGTGYKANDVVTVSGTLLGGTSPTNDITMTVTTVNGYGAITGFTVNGTPTPSMTLVRLYANLPVDVNFAAAGTWHVGYYTGTDGFVWTPNWQKIIGLTNARSSDGEFFTSVAVDKENNVILGMEAYDSNYFSGEPPIALVVKLNHSSGDIVWKGCFDNESAPMSQPLVGCDSENNIVVSVDVWGPYGRTIHKIDPSGSLLWKVFTDSENVFYKYSGTVAIDADDNIIVTGADDEDNWAIDKLDPAGTVLFNRRLTLGYSMYQQEADDGTRWTAVQGDHIWTAGTTYAFADDNYNGFVAKLPLDGSGTTGSTEFDYTDEQIPYARANTPGWVGLAYDALELHASTGITATTSTPSVNTVITWPEDYFTTTTLLLTEPTAGGIVFADGSRQDTSASDLPQRLVQGNNTDRVAAYKLQLTDRGRHIFLTDIRNIYLGNYNETQFPVGSVITIVNYSGGTRRVYFDGNNTLMGVAGTNTTSYSGDIYLEIPFYSGGNIVTLIKVNGEPGQYGNNAPGGYVESGWIASGTNLSFND